MKPLDDDLQQRLDDALEAAAAGRIRDVVTVSDAPADGDEAPDDALITRTDEVLRIVSPDGERAWYARPLDTATPDWWDCDEPTKTLDVLGGLLTSTFFELHTHGASGLGEVPMPELSRKRAAQLAVLFTAFSRADAHGRAALRGSLDRCVADMYGLSLQLLIEIEQHIEPQAPLSSS